MKCSEIESEVERLIEEHGAPELIEEGIRDFLIESGNIYSIIDIAKNCED